MVKSLHYLECSAIKAIPKNQKCSTNYQNKGKISLG
jgi:hypothetical protein